MQRQVNDLLKKLNYHQALEEVQLKLRAADVLTMIGDYHDAIKKLEEAKVYIEAVGSKTKKDYYGKLAYYHLRNESYQAAIDHYQLISGWDNDLEVLAGIKQCLEGLGNAAAAKEMEAKCKTIRTIEKANTEFKTLKKNFFAAIEKSEHPFEIAKQKVLSNSGNKQAFANTQRLYLSIPNWHQNDRACTGILKIGEFIGLNVDILYKLFDRVMELKDSKQYLSAKELLKKLRMFAPHDFNLCYEHCLLLHQTRDPAAAELLSFELSCWKNSPENVERLLKIKQEPVFPKMYANSTQVWASMYFCGEAKDFKIEQPFDVVNISFEKIEEGAEKFLETRFGKK